MKVRVLTLLIGALVVAGGLSAPRGQEGGADVSGTVANVRVTIIGHTLTADRLPFPNASVRLRSLDSGMIVGQTASNFEGEFSFLLPTGGMFVPEVTEKSSGEVLAVGDLVVLEQGEAAGVVVVLPPDLSAYSALFGTTASAMIDLAVNAGIAGVAPGESLSGER